MDMEVKLKMPFFLLPFSELKGYRSGDLTEDMTEQDIVGPLQTQCIIFMNSDYDLQYVSYSFHSGSLEILCANINPSFNVPE